MGNGSKRTDADKKDGNGPDARVTNYHACSPKSADDNRRTVFGHSTIGQGPVARHPLKVVRHAGTRWVSVRMVSRGSMLERDEDR